MASNARKITRTIQRALRYALPFLCFALGAGLMALVSEPKTLHPDPNAIRLPVLAEVQAPGDLLRTVFTDSEALTNAYAEEKASKNHSFSGILSELTGAKLAIAGQGSSSSYPDTPPKTPANRLNNPPKKEPAEQNSAGDIFQTGTLGKMTKLRAELEELKLEVSIEETRARLQQLRNANAPEPKITPRSLPSLDYPPIGMPERERSPQLRILSIQSVNGRYSATIGTAHGPRVVRVNDQVAGGRVVSISRSSVVINRGRGNETLTIQD